MKDTIMTQSTLTITDDLLSAYLDGELSPVEREQVERALARSETLRAEFAQLRQATQAVANLPRVSLPVDFSASVLRAIEERSTVPAAHAGSVWTRHGKKLVAAAAMAACVVVAVQFSSQRPEAPQVAQLDPVASPVEPTTPEPIAKGSPEPISIAAIPGTLTVPAPRGSKDHKALVGRIVDAYDPNGVAVVKVYVVDYDETWQRLQVVLEKSAFVDTDGTGTAVEGTRAAGELVAVLTGSPSDRLEQALAALSKDDGVVGLEVEDEPLLVAALEEKFRGGFAVASAEPANTPVTRTPIRLPGRNAEGADSPITRSVGGSSPLPPPATGAAGNAVADAIRKGTAWSRTVLVPASVIADLSDDEPNDAVAQDNGTAERASTEPLQVLFVLEQAQD
jgi:hypothetical protein